MTAPRGVGPGKTGEVFAKPVELGRGVTHGGNTAYGKYKCRCGPCVRWRRLYDQMTRYRRLAERRAADNGATAYLFHRGIAIYAGPFKNRPMLLARIVAKYFNDNLDVWKEEL